MDERLGVLLEVERKLEERVREREAAVRAQVDAARAALREAQTGVIELEEAALAEAQADESAHAAALALINQEHHAAVAAFERVTGETVERLARRVLSRAMGGSR
jgi:hypothetical protein